MWVIFKASQGHPWCSGSELDYWPTGRVIDPAPGAWFITKFILFAKVVPAQHSLTVQNRGLKHQSFLRLTWIWKHVKQTMKTSVALLQNRVVLCQLFQAMHYILSISVCRPSVCLSVCLSVIQFKNIHKSFINNRSPCVIFPDIF